MTKILCLTNYPDKYISILNETKDIEIVYAKRNDDVSAHYDAEVIFGNLPVSKLKEFKNLKWIQLDSAGADQYCNIADDIILTNSSGAYGVAISEYILGMILLTMKKFDQYLQQQKDAVYNDLGHISTISGSTVLCLGTGDIGSNFARRMKALDAHVIGLSRNVHEKPEWLDEAYTIDKLDELLPEADIIAMSLPQTEKTRHILNANNLPLCKQGSIIVNVGRGSAIDTGALINECNRKRFKAVCLDVQETEPLDPDDPLWHTESVYITPHIAGRQNADITIEKIFSIMYNNLKHYLNNEPLDHVVDKKNRY